MALGRVQQMVGEEVWRKQLWMIVMRTVKTYMKSCWDKGQTFLPEIPTNQH